MNRAELRQLIKEEMEKLIESKYTVTVSQMSSKYDQSNKKEKIFDEESFATEKEAKTFVKQMIKKHKLKRHAGHIVNYSDQKELFTNF